MNVPLDQMQVADVMRHGVLTCQGETSLRTIARMMASHSIHCVVVTNLDGVSESAWGVVSDIDVLRCAREDVDDRAARDVAGTELVTVPPGESLERAAQVMAEHEITHVVVVSEERPIGILSSLDVAACLAQA